MEDISLVQSVGHPLLLFLHRFQGCGARINDVEAGAATRAFQGGGEDLDETASSYLAQLN